MTSDMTLQLKSYIASLPPVEKANFEKFDIIKQISIMNESLSFCNLRNDNGYINSAFNNQPTNNEFYNIEVSQQVQQVRQSVVQHRANNYESAKASFTQQMNKDGWAGNVADGMSALWNNNLWNATGNRAKFIRQDLEKYKQETNILQQAVKSGIYPAKFKDIYGIDYNESNIKEFNAVETEFKNVSTAVATSRAIQSQFENSLKIYNSNFGRYQDYTEALHGPTGSTNRVTSKEFLLMTLKSQVEDTVGGAGVVEKIAQQSKIDLSKLTDEQKYKFYGQVATKLVESVQNNEKKSLNGKSYDTYIKNYNDSMHKAFGTKNDIQERVQKYNTSQEIGTAAVKAGAKSVIVVGSSIAIVGSGGTATPLIVAGLTTTASIGVDISDNATNNIDGDLDNGHVQNIVKSGFIDGVLAYGGGNIAKNLTGVVHTSSNIGQKVWNFTANGIGSAAEGTVKDILNDGFDNASSETFAVRALVSATLGNVKMFTDNTAFLNSLKVTQSSVTGGTLKSVKLQISQKAKVDDNAKQVYAWIESHPEDFKQMVFELSEE